MDMPSKVHKPLDAAWLMIYEPWDYRSLFHINPLLATSINNIVNGVLGTSAEAALMVSHWWESLLITASVMPGETTWFNPWVQTYVSHPGKKSRRSTWIGEQLTWLQFLLLLIGPRLVIWILSWWSKHFDLNSLSLPKLHAVESLCEPQNFRKRKKPLGKQCHIKFQSPWEYMRLSCQY